METDIRHTESVLNDATDEANDLVERELGERVPDPPNWSKRRPRANKNHVEAALEEIVRRGRGPEADEGLRSAASEAQERLDDIRRLRGQLRELNDELRRARETGSAPSSPTGPEEGGSSVEKLRAEASAYAEKVAKLERSVKAIDTDAAALEKRAAAIRKQLLSQQIDPETFFAQSKALDGERQALANRRKGLSDEASSLRGEAEATVARMVTEMPTEMEATFHSKNPKEILARGHMVEEGSLSASGMFSVFNA
ncbi:MAG: hypothetical protein ACXU7X_12560, partial [Croceibacterium sp.]